MILFDTLRFLEHIDLANFIQKKKRPKKQPYGIRRNHINWQVHSVYPLKNNNTNMFIKTNVWYNLPMSFQNLMINQ